MVRVIRLSVATALLLVICCLAALAQTPREKERLVRQVRHELVMLPNYGLFDNLAFEIAPNGKVILSGSVTRPTLKSEAENVVKTVEGVETIENRIEVLPLSPDDDRVRLAMFRAVYGKAGLDRYALQAVPSIHIIAKNGHVVLEGVVNSESDKNLAEMQAKGVPGVFSVKNNLRVEK